MCEKVKGCNRQIDLCLREKIIFFNKQGLKTISSCCGHGKYEPTIIIRRKDNIVYEFFTRIQLRNYNPKKDKRHNSYYKKDSEGIYYIPEVIS